ncbi:hypothetical protein HZH66_007737 [Vespula vulgaris]|uniref:Uncharacterized protein n=1 Tax=Vespula vulgaris TaxID=7454 RepID=A0A834N507_VESVU|nr:hypothetical protein HZH66_007737 [Vespula vulgaris]
MVATEAGGYVTGEKDSKEGSVPDIGSRKNKELEFQSSGCQARSNETRPRIPSTQRNEAATTWIIRVPSGPFEFE